MSCTNYKSLTLNFTAPSIPPADGYLVKWRVAGDANYTTVTPNPKNTPIVIPQVPACANIEGTIQTACGNGNYGSPLQFVVAPDPNSVSTCAYYSVVNNSDNPDDIATSDLWVRYKPCGSDTFVSLRIPSGTLAIATGICADVMYGVTKVSGTAGTITKEGPCSNDNPDVRTYV